MRIVYLTKINFASVRTNVYNTAHTCEALNTLPKVEATLVSTHPLKDKEVFFEAQHVSQPFPVVALDMPARGYLSKGGRIRHLMLLLWSNVYLGVYLFRRRHTFDVLYLRDEGLTFAALVARIAGKPVFFEIHSVLVGWHRQLLNHILIRLSVGVIAISKRLKEYYAHDHDKIAVSYCGADESFMYSSEEVPVSNMREELSLPRSSFIVGYVGVIGKNANDDVYETDLIIESLALLPENVTYVLVGERGGDAGWLREIAKKYGVEDRVVIRPWVERGSVHKYLKSFDVIMIPRRRKDLASDSPLKMFTALSVGKPIVAGHSDSITEILKDGENALIVRENNAEGYAEKIKVLMEGGAHVQDIALQAKKDAKKYTWEKRAAALAAFIEETLRVEK